MIYDANMSYESILHETRTAFRRLVLISARAILACPSLIPQEPGMYFFFAANGTSLLRAAGYFSHDARLPLVRRQSVHLYTGRSFRLRTRIRCHLLGSAEESCLRKTLVVLERARGAISKTRTPYCKVVVDRRGLTNWLAANSSFAFVLCEDERDWELEVLRVMASPLNLRPSTNLTFAMQLLKWRARHFPHGGPF